MKKHIVLFVIFSGSLFCNAQNQSFEFGINAGYGFATILGKNASETGNVNSDVALLIGANFKWRFTEYFGVYTSVSYAEVGVTSELRCEPFFGDPDYLSFIYPYSANSEYLSIPVLFRGELGESVRFFGQVGIQMDVLLSRTISRDLRWPHDELPTEHPNLGKLNVDDVTKSANTFEFSGVLGLGVGFKLSNRVVLDTELRGIVGFKSWQYGHQYEYSNAHDPNAYYEGRFAQALFVVSIKYVLE